MSSIGHFERVRALHATPRFVVTAVGVLSIPTRPSFKGMETFKGLSFHPFDWPHDQPDLTGKRVFIFGDATHALAAAVLDRREDVCLQGVGQLVEVREQVLGFAEIHWG